MRHLDAVVIEKRPRGRPKIQNSRYRSFRIRLTEFEYQQLDEISKGTGMSKSEIFRSVLGIRKGENQYDLKNRAEEKGDSDDNEI